MEFATGHIAAGYHHAIDPSASASQRAANPGRLRRVEQQNMQAPIEKKPEWIKTVAKTGPNYSDVKSLVGGAALHTVCQSAGCPNVYECWEDREATFLVGGNVCTRRCDFCAIDTGKPGYLDTDEPRRVAESVKHLGLRYATVTGVARDDLPDGGAWIYAETARQIHALSRTTTATNRGALRGDSPRRGGSGNPVQTGLERGGDIPLQNEQIGVELLVPDFKGNTELIDIVIESQPEVFGHNVETVPRIFKRIRPAFNYELSLSVLEHAHNNGLITKSNLMLGMGETDAEIVQALKDLRSVNCDLITITQYLRPAPQFHRIERWVKPQEFKDLEQQALALGFKGVMSGPLVRSSYRAGQLWRQAIGSGETQ